MAKKKKSRSVFVITAGGRVDAVHPRYALEANRRSYKTRKQAQSVAAATAKKKGKKSKKSASGGGGGG